MPYLLILGIYSFQRFFQIHPANLSETNISLTKCFCQVFEENDFRGSQLAQTISYDSYGHTGKITIYAADGKTVNQVQINQFNTAGQWVASTLTDGQSNVIEKDSFSYDKFGLLVKETRFKIGRAHV